MYVFGFCVCVRYGIYLIKPSVRFGKILIFPCLLIMILSKSLILFQVLYCLVMEPYRCYYCNNGYENFEMAILHGSQLHQHDLLKVRSPLSKKIRLESTDTPHPSCFAEEISDDESSENVDNDIEFLIKQTPIVVDKLRELGMIELWKTF